MSPCFCFSVITAASCTCWCTPVACMCYVGHLLCVAA
jgi:hypothetical protein